MTITEEKGYPPLLFVAVKSGNELAVGYLLENGAAPTTKFRRRYGVYYIINSGIGLCTHVHGVLKLVVHGDQYLSYVLIIRLHRNVWRK